MFTVKVVTEWCGSANAAPPDLKGPIRPAEHVFEAKSYYNDAGRIIFHGVPDYEKDGESGSVTYNEVVYDKPWKQTIYVMNSRGATVSSMMIGSHGGDIGCPARMRDNPWHPIEIAKTTTPKEQPEVASGVAAQ